MQSQTEDYEKIKRVIYSCENGYQVITAGKIVENYNKTYDDIIGTCTLQRIIHSLMSFFLSEEGQSQHRKNLSCARCY